MNNYCTNCGKKLVDNSKFCTKCGTPVVNLYNSEENKEKRRNIYKKVGLVFLALFIFFVLYVLYHLLILPHYYRSIYNKEVATKLESYDIKSWKLRHQSVCMVCDGGCNGACLSYKKVDNCYDFKTNIVLNNGIVIKRTFTVQDKILKSEGFDKLQEIIQDIKTMESILEETGYRYDISFDEDKKNYVININENITTSLTNGILDTLNSIYRNTSINKNIEVDFLDNYHMIYNGEIFSIIYNNDKSYLHDRYDDSTLEEIIKKTEELKES